MLFNVTNISAKILLPILGYSFLCRAPYFATFSPIAVGVKIIKNYLRKSCSALAIKMLVKLTPANITLARQNGATAINILRLNHSLNNKQP